MVTSDLRESLQTSCKVSGLPHPCPLPSANTAQQTGGVDKVSAGTFCLLFTNYPYSLIYKALPAYYTFHNNIQQSEKHDLHNR